MRLSIVCDDKAVYKDGVSIEGLDLSFIDSNIHALQWYETYGEIEYKRQFVDGTIYHPQNLLITELPAWANQAIDVFETQKAEILRLQLEAQARYEAEQLANPQPTTDASNGVA